MSNTDDAYARAIAVERKQARLSRFVGPVDPRRASCAPPSADLDFVLQRDTGLLWMRQQGFTLQNIGEAMQLSRERVRQMERHAEKRVKSNALSVLCIHGVHALLLELAAGAPGTLVEKCRRRSWSTAEHRAHKFFAVTGKKEIEAMATQISDLVPLKSYGESRHAIFPSEQSLKWYFRVNKSALVEADVAFLIAGRIMVDAKAFDAFLLKKGAADIGAAE